MSVGTLRRHPVVAFAIAAVVLAFAFVAPAGAAPLRINFAGASSGGHVDLTLSPDTVAGDPSGAQSITDATGAYSNATLGISNATIVGVRALNFATPPPNETLPGSYSALVPSATPVGSYDNLFYVGGSPLVCIVNGVAVYPFSGGLFDIFGVMLELDNGNFVDLWSNGVMPGLGLNYGLAVFGVENGSFVALDTQENGVTASVPEPPFIWLFGAGLVALFAWRRTRERESRATVRNPRA